MADVQMTIEEFQRISATLSRWSEKSLSIARLALVDGQSSGEIAEREKVTTAHVRVIRNRFLDKRKKVLLDEFTALEQGQLAPFKQYEAEILALWDKGYDESQIWRFLTNNGVDVQPKALIRFIRSVRA